MRAGAGHRIAPAVFGEGRRRLIRRNESENVAIPTVDISICGVADADCILQHRVKNRLQFAGRLADDAQHFRGRRLLLQRFAQIVGAPPQLVEQPRVLDGDDGLGGEVRE